MANTKKKDRVLTETEKKLAALKLLKAPTDAQLKQMKELVAASKAERFSRLASKRVGKALNTIKLVGNLSGSGYAYTQDQVKKIESLLNGAVNSVIGRFAPGQKAAAQAEIEI